MDREAWHTSIYGVPKSQTRLGGFTFFFTFIYIYTHMTCIWASLVAQLVKKPPAMWETWVQSLGWEDPLEKGKATHSSILAWRIPWIIFHGVAKSGTQLSNFHLMGQES